MTTPTTSTPTYKVVQITFYSPQKTITQIALEKLYQDQSNISPIEWVNTVYNPQAKGYELSPAFFNTLTPSPKTS